MSQSIWTVVAFSTDFTSGWLPANGLYIRTDIFKSVWWSWWPQRVHTVHSWIKTWMSLDVYCRRKMHVQPTALKRDFKTSTIWGWAVIYTMFYFMRALNNSSLFFSHLHNKSKHPELQEENIWRRLEQQQKLSGHPRQKGFPQQMLRICQFETLPLAWHQCRKTPPLVCVCVCTHA